jgi:hypothetical protein
MEIITNRSESKNNNKIKKLPVKLDDNGNLLRLYLSIEDKRITLINIYGPNVDTPCFYNKVAEMCVLKTINIIVF